MANLGTLGTVDLRESQPRMIRLDLTNEVDRASGAQDFKKSEGVVRNPRPGER
jgi:hypothetical protein